MSKRPPGIVAIVCYKVFSATLLTITSISILLALKRHVELQHFANSLALAGKKGVIALVLEKVLNLHPRTLQFGSVAAAVYAIITAIEAVGLWYEKEWARWLIVGAVAISIPPEIFELVKGFSWFKLIVFLLNIVILIYLIWKFPSGKNKISA